MKQSAVRKHPDGPAGPHKICRPRFHAGGNFHFRHGILPGDRSGLARYIPRGKALPGHLTQTQL